MKSQCERNDRPHHHTHRKPECVVPVPLPPSPLVFFFLYSATMLFNDVNFLDPDFIWAALVIVSKIECGLPNNEKQQEKMLKKIHIFNPTWWNIVARAEYRTHFLTKLFGGQYPLLNLFLLFLSFLMFSFFSLNLLKFIFN